MVEMLNLGAVAKLKAIKAELQRRSIIVRPRSVHDSGKLCWDTANSMPFRVTRLSFASLVVAFAGCGGASLSVADNAHTCDGIVFPQS